MVREELVASAVDFLLDPGTSSSPIESRIAFLRSKNLTQEEIDTALARTQERTNPSQGIPTSPQPSYVGQSAARQYQQAPYQGGYWQQQAQPPLIPRRDWRDWFIMATVVGGVGYGMFVVAKRYIAPLIAPPTPPQLEADKAAIDASFTQAFTLLDQLCKDTEELKMSEKARTERLDTALAEVSTVVSELKLVNRRREDDSRRVGDEIRALKELIPKAIREEKGATDGRLKDLNAELKSLKTLVGNRIGAGQQQKPFSAMGTSGIASGAATPNGNAEAITNGESRENDAGSSTATKEAPMPFKPQSGNRAAIPAWQMAAAKKSSESADISLGSEV